MTAIAVETTLELPPPRAVLDERSDSQPEASPLGQLIRVTDRSIEPWELHSELVLVCPELRRRALELLPERDPYAFLAKPRQPMLLPSELADEGELMPGVPTAVAAYALWRLLQTARSALVFVGGVVALASLAEVVH